MKHLRTIAVLGCLSLMMGPVAEAIRSRESAGAAGRVARRGGRRSSGPERAGGSGSGGKGSSWGSGYSSGY